MRRNKIIIWSLLLTIVAGILFGCSYSWMKQTVHSNKVVARNTRMTPVIFVPGSAATQERFNSLFESLNKDNNQKHSVLKVTVQIDGKIKESGKITPRDTQPFIVIAFQNNEDGYTNIKRQVKWFNLAFKKLSKQYRFNTFNAVGHSNGGLVLSFFLEDDMDQTKYTINRLVTIGTPFNLEESNPKNKTQMLTDLITNKNALPKKLQMYSIAGTVTYTSDGIVPVDSVNSGKYVYQNTVKNYTELTVTGTDSEHSDLVDNEEIVSLIERYVITPERSRIQQPRGSVKKPQQKQPGSSADGGVK